MGQAPSGDAYNTDGVGWPLIAGAGDFGEIYPAAKKYTTEASRLSQPDDIVLGIRASIGDKVLSDGIYCLGRGVAGLRPCRDHLDSRYLWHWLTFSRWALAAKAKGATFKQVNRDDIGGLTIPLLPLPEQRRIADILDQAEALRAKRRTALVELDTLTQSIFTDLFGYAADWPTKSLADVAQFFAGGTLPPGTSFEGQHDGYLLLKVSDMNLPGNEKYLQWSQGWKDMQGPAAATCPANSVVIPKRGGAITTNKKRITTRLSILDPNLMAISPSPDSITTNYLFGWFERLDLSGLISGSSVPQLNKQDLAPLQIAVPPMELQVEYEHRIRSTEAFASRQTSSQEYLNDLFASLQHRAFRGDL
jgi:type I restriction enzyme S subunit